MWRAHEYNIVGVIVEHCITLFEYNIVNIVEVLTPKQIQKRV